MKFSTLSIRLAVRAILACGLLMAAFNYRVDHLVGDSFHEGEYLGALFTMRAYLGGTSPYPLLVHGPMDFIPVLIAAFVSGDQSTIVLTRAINTLITGISWILVLDILLILQRRNEYRAAAGIASCLMFVGMIVVIPADAVERQQAFIAVRDVFLVAALWFTLRGLLTRSCLLQYGLIMVGGAAAAASLYWAYDRFLAAIAFSGALLLSLVLQRAWKLAAVFLAGAGAGLFIIPNLAPTGTLVENAGNLAYWLKFSGEVWKMSYLSRLPAAPTAVAMIMLLLIFAKAWYYEYSSHRSDLVISFFAGLITLQTFFLIKYFILPRYPNNYYFVWPFVLLLAGLTLNWSVSRKVDDILRNLWAAITSGGLRQRLGLVAIALSFVLIVTNNMAFASFMNLRALARPPADVQLLPVTIRTASFNLPLPNDGCVLLWSNEGLFATALRRPFCTRYMYPVYVSASHESEILRQIKNAPPAVVIFDTPFWSMNIYGRTMQQRLPAVDKYLRSHYQFLSRGGYKVGIRLHLESAAERR